MSVFKVPKKVLNTLESIRRNFFNGIEGKDRKMSWISLAFLSQGSTLWIRTIKTIYGKSGSLDSLDHSSRRSPWLDIVRKITILRSKGIDILPFIRKNVGEFSVKSVHSHIDDTLLPKEDVRTRWVNVVPIKINVFAWRVRLDILPT
ncbi:hypothetical protein Tco_0522622 [Tanacetum coccineum]